VNLPVQFQSTIAIELAAATGSTSPLDQNEREVEQERPWVPKWRAQRQTRETPGRYGAASARRLDELVIDVTGKRTHVPGNINNEPGGMR
jgi:hypothetical protein